METERPIRGFLQVRQGMMAAWTRVAPGKVLGVVRVLIYVQDRAGSISHRPYVGSERKESRMTPKSLFFVIFLYSLHVGSHDLPPPYTST